MNRFFTFFFFSDRSTFHSRGAGIKSYIKVTVSQNTPKSLITFDLQTPTEVRKIFKLLFVYKLNVISSRTAELDCA